MPIYKITMPDCDANIKVATKAYRNATGSPVEFKKVVTRRGKYCIELRFTDIKFYISIVKLGFTGSLKIENLSWSETHSRWYDENKDYTAEPILGAWCKKPISNSVDERLSPSEKHSPRLADHVEEHLQRLRQYSPDESKTQIAHKILEEFQSALVSVQKYLDEGLNQEIVHKRIVDEF